MKARSDPGAPGSAPVVVGVVYDFASTICFVAHRVMARLEPRLEELGILLLWRPIDLTRLVSWSRGRCLPAEARLKAEQVARELGVAVDHIPRLWMDSRAAAALSMSLDPDLERSFRAAVWDSVYRDGRTLDDPALLPDLLERLGAAEIISAFEAARSVRAVKQLDAVTRDAQALGVAGVPSFLLGEWPVGGIQSEDTMLHFLGRYAKRRRADTLLH